MMAFFNSGGNASKALAAGDLVEHRPHRGPRGREDLRGVHQEATAQALGVVRQQPGRQHRGARVGVHEPGIASKRKGELFRYRKEL